ncbi:MAG: putative DNA modification/repair radical SAM protein [Anaerococcus sp.]
MNTNEKLKILTDAAKYDVSCSSSGSSRKNTKKGLGNGSISGICHSWSEDGRCISLLKVLFTNKCIYDCEYCVNRRTNDVTRAEFSPRELADLTINFYKRNYIEGLFLSSAVIKNPDYTMELLIELARILRYEYKFNGYMHMKAIPGASPDLIEKIGLLVDRMSINIELADRKDLALLAPEKNYDSILSAMDEVKNRKIQAKNEIMVYKHAPKFLPAGQTTQMIVGARKESDLDIITKSESLYDNYSLKRVYYSAFVPVVKSNLTQMIDKAPLLREHRLYQADWLLRFYGFRSKDLLNKKNPSFDLRIDPKTNWAIENIEKFPLEINKASYDELIKVPGIGKVYAKRILAARKFRKLDYSSLKSLKISTKRAKNFILADGKYYGLKFSSKSELKNYMSLSDTNSYEQLSFLS